MHHSPPPTRAASRAVRLRAWRRPSFTLTELLIVIMLIALLASMTMFGMYGVMEEAKAARTRAQIDKLNQLIMDKWDGYRTRPVPIRIPQGTSAQLAAAWRLTALRELMRMEMPDRISDVVSGPVTPNLSRPALSQRYANRVATTTWTLNPGYQGAECLYLIIAMMQDGDSNGLDFFKSSEIGDVDQDGAKEILDAWGNPITFIRWPVGYDSPIQPQPTNLAEFQTRNSERPDPFDPMRVDQLFWDPNKFMAMTTWTTRMVDADSTNDPFSLIPLIYSAGPDKAYGVGDNTAFDYSATVWSPPTAYGPNDPYALINTPTAIGTRIPGAGFGDNISNHLTGTN